MPAIDHSLRIAIQAVDRFSRPMSKMNRKVSGLVQTMNRAGKSMSLGLSLPLAIAGVSIFRTAAAFESEMLRVRALTRAGGEDFEKLKTQARGLGATTVFTATQVADAMGFMSMAGLSVNEIYASMPHALDLAASANIDFATAADIVTNILRGFNMDATNMGHAVDVLVEGFTDANTDLVQLGDAMRYVAPIAQGLNLSLEQTVAVLGAMGDAGIQASMAGTSLRGGLARIAELSEGAKDTMKGLGIAYEQVFQDDGRMRPFLQVLDVLGKAGAKVEDVLKIFELRAGPAMQALITRGVGGIADKAEFLRTGVTGRAAEVAAVRMAGASGAVLRFSAAMQELQIAIADSGFLTWMTESINSLAAWTREMAKTNPDLLNLGVKIAAVAILAGPLLVALGGLLAIFAALASPIGLVIAAIAGIGAAIWATWVDIKFVGFKIKQFWLALDDMIWGFVKSIGSGISGLWKDITDGISDSIDWLLGRTDDVASKVKSSSDRTAKLVGRGDEFFGPALSPKLNASQSGLPGANSQVDVRFSNTPEGTSITSQGEGLNLDVGFVMGPSG